MSLTCYYAHCTALYGSHQERRDVVTLTELGLDVCNPNNQGSIQQAKQIRENGGTSEHVMARVFLPLVDECDCIAFRALPDGSIPAGVHQEVMRAKTHKKPVIELPNAVIRRGLNVEDTREYLEDIGYR